MDNLTDLTAMISENEGFLNVKDALRLGFSKPTVDEAVTSFNLSKLTPGFYLTPEAAKDEMFFIRKFSNDAVFSHETALYLHRLTDSNSSKWVITAPSGYSGIHLRAMDVEVHFMKKDLYKLGMIEAKSNYCRKIYTYDMERTLCDILRSNNKLSAATLEEALTRYAAREDKDLELLEYYAKQFHIEGLLKKYSVFL